MNEHGEKASDSKAPNVKSNDWRKRKADFRKKCTTEENALMNKANYVARQMPRVIRSVQKGYGTQDYEIQLVVETLRTLLDRTLSYVATGGEDKKEK